METTQQIEKIYRVWSSHRADQIAIRVEYEIDQAGPAKLFVLGAREEWF